MALPGRGVVILERRGRKEFREHKGFKVLRAFKVPVDLQEALVLKVIKAFRVPPDLQVLLVLKVYREHKAFKVLKAFRVLQVPVVQQVVLDQLDLKVLMETSVVPRLTIHLALQHQTVTQVQGSYYLIMRI